MLVKLDIVPIIELGNAGVDPKTVMVKVFNTYVAMSTMLATIINECVAVGAMITHPISYLS